MLFLCMGEMGEMGLPASFKENRFLINQKLGKEVLYKIKSH